MFDPSIRLRARTLFHNGLAMAALCLFGSLQPAAADSADDAPPLEELCKVWRGCPKVGEDVYATLEQHPTARVVIGFEPPVDTSRGGGTVDTTKLLGFGYDEAAADISAINATADTLLARVPPGQFTLEHRFDLTPALVGDITGYGLLALAEDPAIRRIDLEWSFEPMMGEARPISGIEDVHAGSPGYKGAGVTIAVLDSGLRTDHMDFDGRIVGTRNFVCSSPNCIGAVPDSSGHGTRVTGAAAGAGNHAPRGAAPEADLVIAKISNPLRSGVGFLTAALEWIHEDRPDVDLINISAGVPEPRYADDCSDLDDNANLDMLRDAVLALRAREVLVFAAAGNARNSAQSDASGIAFPACLPEVFAVGAIYDGSVNPSNGSPNIGCIPGDTSMVAGQVACLSHRGPRIDLMAPGAYITATSRDGIMAEDTSVGTSYASPIATGCAALLQEAAGRELGRKLAPDEITFLLRFTGTRVDEPNDASGTVWYQGLSCQAAIDELTRRGTQEIDNALLTGTWWQPATSGQGMIIEVNPGNSATSDYDTVVVGWYTYADQGSPDDQRWYVGVGKYHAGEGFVIMPIHETVGGRFDVGTEVENRHAGTAKLTFESCDQARLDYVFDQAVIGKQRGTIHLERTVANGLCADPTAPRGDFGLSGTWFEPATNGQGLLVEISPTANDNLFAGWYTYTEDGGAGTAADQVWYTIQGANYNPSDANRWLGIYRTTGGLFDTPNASLPQPPTTIQVGTARWTFPSCTQAQLRYYFDDGRSGTLDLVRLTPNVLCQD